jgi:hypothetical protein
MMGARLFWTLIGLLLGLAAGYLAGAAVAGAVMAQDVACPVGDVVVRCMAGETPVACTVLLRYEGEGLSPIVTAGPGGVWAGPVTPGVYQVIMQTWHASIDVMPIVIYPVWALVSAGRPTAVNLPFWAAIPPTPTGVVTALSTATGTPTAVATPTPTATVAAHQCPAYQVNCMKVPVCPDGTWHDGQGACGQGFLCCVPFTRTPTATRTGGPGLQSIPTMFATPFVTPTASRTRTATMQPVKLPKTGG